MIQTLQKQINYTFKNGDLLAQAITHRSKHNIHNNERLEFLGDAILSAVISHELFNRYPDAREGELSRLRAALVKGETLAKKAHALGFDKVLQLGVGESKSGGHLRESILSGAFEAVIGAVYLDSTFETISALIIHWFQDYLSNATLLTDIKDAKSSLQEWMQSQQLPLPQYDVTISGLAHQQVFDVTCHVEGMDIVTHGSSNSRRRAEQLAAKAFLEKLNERQ